MEYDDYREPIEMDGDSGTGQFSLIPLLRTAPVDDSAIPSPTWLIDRVLPITGLSVWYGLPGSYKSLLALSAGAAVAYGETMWLGQRVWAANRSVLLLDSETGQDGQLERLEALYSRPTDYPIQFSMAPSLPHTLAVDAFADLCKRAKPSLVIVDSASILLNGIDMNAPVMGEALTRIRAVAVAYSCCVLMVHQANKSSSESSGRGQDVMGSGYWTAVSDVPYRVVRDDGVDSAGVSLRLSKQRRNAVPRIGLAVTIHPGYRVDQWGAESPYMAKCTIERTQDIPDAAPRASRLIDCVSLVIDEITSGACTTTSELHSKLEPRGYSGATVDRAVKSAMASGSIVRSGRGVYAIPITGFDASKGDE